MNREELSTLIKIKAEIEQIRHELDTVDIQYETDAVTGSSPNFPYVKHSILISGYNDKNYKYKTDRITNRLNKKLIELVAEKDKLTEYIYSLKDSELRQILTYKYVNGFTWIKIGEKMNYSFETVRKKHDKFIKTIPPITILRMLN